MLTDAALKSLKPKAKMYKVTDRDGMYVRVAPSGAISFRLDYRLGAPATAIHVRDILKQIFGFAILPSEKVANPVDDVGPASIATFTPKDRALSPTEIRIMLKQLEHVATMPTIRLGMKLYLLTMVRKSELQDAVWDEVDFDNSVCTIPKERMKRSKPIGETPDEGECAR